MKIFVVLASYLAFGACGVIHDDHHKGHQATSYQSIHMEHFHAVPTYIKKEDMHYLEHPVSEGKTEAKVEVHHGSKHEPGYAVANIQSEIHGHHDGHHFVAAGGHSYEDHGSQDGGKHYEDSHLQSYQGHGHEQDEGYEHGQELGQGQEQGHEHDDAGQQYSYENQDGGAGEDASYQYQAEEGHGSYEQHHAGGEEGGAGGEHY